MIPIKSNINCRTISGGVAEGEVLITSDTISFLGNVDPETGIVVEPSHELFNKSIKGKVLIFPHGKGSTVGSYVLYQLSKNNVAPAAMINIESEPIVAVGAIISGIPLVDKLGSDPYTYLTNGTLVKVDGDNSYIKIIE
ncbi:MAG: DUF126 domain-containing protein [Methanohalobium sp.]|uniref:DUF126 domain-containing protein n=1 Tax=Methanohalobium sp. TaxID=2837493 RepID=UPI00397CA96F